MSRFTEKRSSWASDINIRGGKDNLEQIYVLSVKNWHCCLLLCLEKNRENWWSESYTTQYIVLALPEMFVATLLCSCFFRHTQSYRRSVQHVFSLRPKSKRLEGRWRTSSLLLQQRLAKKTICSCQKAVKYVMVTVLGHMTHSSDYAMYPVQLNLYFLQWTSIRLSEFKSHWEHIILKWVRINTGI